MERLQKIFKENGRKTHVTRLAHHFNAYNAENIASIGGTMADSPNMWTPLRPSN